MKRKASDPIDQKDIDIPEDSILPSEVPVTMGDISLSPKNAIEPSEEDKVEPVKTGPGELDAKKEYEEISSKVSEA